jgi:hypothetical protein
VDVNHGMPITEHGDIGVCSERNGREARRWCCEILGESEVARADAMFLFKIRE